MANKSLFASIAGKLLPKAEARNEAGGAAYALTPKQALAQYAATGCMNSTFYASADEQLTKVIELASQVEPEFVARVALYTRSKSNMKDTPALLVAVLSVLSPGLMAEVFDRGIDSPTMLRNFVQIMRSGVVGRKSLGTLPKRLVLQWLERRTDEQIFRASVGNDPSLADVIRMVHPKPTTASRAALYGYLLGKPYDIAALPELVKAFEEFKATPSKFGGFDLPDVPMDMLTSLPLEKRHWEALARKASWQSLRMNLNTFTRHGVFADQASVSDAAIKLRDEQAIAKARVFPYQLMAAFVNTGDDVPARLKDALQDAMEIAIGNVPAIDGKVWVFPDVSGSMQSPVTGNRKGSTSKVRWRGWARWPPQPKPPRSKQSCALNGPRPARLIRERLCLGCWANLPFHSASKASASSPASGPNAIRSPPSPTPPSSPTAPTGIPFSKPPCAPTRRPTRGKPPSGWPASLPRPRPSG
jgi:60 kDa SS-A/Ro ribonucleoprotein